MMTSQWIESILLTCLLVFRASLQSSTQVTFKPFSGHHFFNVFHSFHKNSHKNFSNQVWSKTIQAANPIGITTSNRFTRCGKTRWNLNFMLLLFRLKNIAIGTACLWFRYPNKIAMHCALYEMSCWNKPDWSTMNILSRSIWHSWWVTSDKTSLRSSILVVQLPRIKG